MKIHPAAAVFPDLSADRLAELTADIQANGLEFPVVLYKGAILDGRHRWKACEALGIEPPTVEWKPKNGDTPERFVLSANLHRRDLDKGQRAFLVIHLAPKVKAEAKERQRAGGKEGGKKAGRGRPAKGGATSGTSQSEKSRDVLAEMAGVSHTVIDQAVKIAEMAPEVAAKVIAGEMTHAQAVREVLPTPQQKADEEPAVKWHRQLSKIYEVVNGIRHDGGIVKVVKGWSPERRAQIKDDLLRLSTELREQAETI